MSKEWTLGKRVALNTGATMPMLALGTWKIERQQVKAVLETAIELGYRHIDCSAVYENEKEIGSALRDIFADQQRFKVQRKDVPQLLD